MPPIASTRTLLAPAARAAALAALVALTLGGCWLHHPHDEMPEPEPPVFLDAESTVLAEFPADGSWHRSGFMARAGDRLRFHASGAAADLPHRALLVSIGRTGPQMVYGTSPQRVGQPGEIFFRLDPSGAGTIPVPNTIRILIVNHRVEPK